MPSPRKLKQHQHSRHQSRAGFELFDEDMQRDGEKIEVYTDANARVPQMDEAEENPFVGRRTRPQRKSRKAPTSEEEEMLRAAQRDEGVVYVL